MNSESYRATLLIHVKSMNKYIELEVSILGPIQNEKNLRG